MKQLPYYLPVIITSAIGDVGEVRDRVNDSGADDILMKPIQKKALLTRIRTYKLIKDYQDRIDGEIAGNVPDDLLKIGELIRKTPQKARYESDNGNPEGCEENLDKLQAALSGMSF